MVRKTEKKIIIILLCLHAWTHTHTHAGFVIMRDQTEQAPTSVATTALIFNKRNKTQEEKQEPVCSRLRFKLRQDVRLQ